MPSFAATKGTFKQRARNLPKEVDFFGRKWAKSMDQFLEAVGAIGGDIEGVFRVSAGKFFRNVQLRTPVDEGTARRGWHFEDGAAPPGEVLIVITNSVMYIVYLEFGWSKQAPNGMVRIELDAMGRKLKQAVMRLVT